MDIIADQVYPCTDSAMELFENRAYMCGISLEKDSGDSEESGDYSSQGNCSFSEPHSWCPLMWLETISCQYLHI